jgi:uncharacterized protein
MEIAIMGAGVSGLTTAYFIKTSSNPILANANVTVFEKASDVGGNANTFNVDVIGAQGQKIPRWVDMGVNDFNLSTYKPLIDLWEELKIMNPTLPCPTSQFCSPLINTESFSFPSSDYSFPFRYWINEDDTVDAPPDSQAYQYRDTLHNDIERFKTELAKWYADNEEEGKNPVNVGDWLKTISPPFSDVFISTNLYPRINGMYFTMENYDSQGTPPVSQMPLWMVAHYYILQEAYGQATSGCPRQYFIKGSSQWLKFLRDKLVSDYPSPGFNIGYNFPDNAFIKPSGSQLSLNAVGSQVGIFDKIIFATHADDTYKMMQQYFSHDFMVANLPSFQYSTCEIYAHQDPTFLGPKQDCNRTYNIHINSYQPGTTVYPYSISYIVNMHQNDAAKGINDPLFFLTCNPFWGIPRNILNISGTTKLARTTMRHCKLDTPAMNAQIHINNEQIQAPGERNYYFAGSFTRGAGLHMECILQAKDIANKLANPSYVSEELYDFEGKTGRHFAPKYVLDAITRLKKKD